MPGDLSAQAIDAQRETDQVTLLVVNDELAIGASPKPDSSVVSYWLIFLSPLELQWIGRWLTTVAADTYGPFAIAVERRKRNGVRSLKRRVSVDVTRDYARSARSDSKRGPF